MICPIPACFTPGGTTFSQQTYVFRRSDSAIELGNGGRPMKLSDIVLNAQRKAGRVDPDFNERTRIWINEAKERWIMSSPHPDIRFSEDFTCDGTQNLYLPGYIRKIVYIMDKTNKRPVYRHEEWDREAPSLFAEKTSGSARWWREIGKSPVSAQPTQASQVYLDPAAVENVVCYVEGLAQDTLVSGTAVNRYLCQEVVTCMSGGETQTGNFYVQMLTIGKNTLTAGDVTVAYASGGTTIARLFRNAYSTSYNHVQLLLVPPKGTVVTVKYVLGIPDLVDDNHVVHPAVNAEYLAWYAAGCIHKAMNQGSMAEQAYAHAEELLSRETLHEQNHGDQDLRTIPDYEYFQDTEDD